MILGIVPVVFVLAALLLFVRWKETGDRSAYAIGAAFAIAAPIVVGIGVVDVLSGSQPSGSGNVWTVRMVDHWFSLAAGIAYVALTLRAWVLTGMFVMAAQQTIRQRFHAVETTWQYAVAVAGTGYLVSFLADVVERLMA